MTRDDEGFRRIGDRRVEIVGVRVNGRDATAAEPAVPVGGRFSVELDYVAHVEVTDAVFGASAHTPDGSVRCFDLTTAHAGITVGSVQGRGRVRLDMDRLDLRPGMYNLDVGVFRADWEHPYDYHWTAYPFEVVGKGTGGLLDPPHRWSLDT